MLVTVKRYPIQLIMSLGDRPVALANDGTLWALHKGADGFPPYWQPWAGYGGQRLPELPQPTEEPTDPAGRPGIPGDSTPDPAV
jgi:hypothetical protein